MENYVIITKQDGMIKYYTDAPCCVFNRFFECAHLFHNLGDAKRAWNAIGTFAKYKCQIVEVTFAPLKKVPRG
jgi:hypothetical protein